MTQQTSEPKTQRVRLNLAPAVADRLRALAKADNRTLSGYVTNLIDKQELPE